MNPKNILFLTVLCCAINITAAPKSNHKSGKTPASEEKKPTLTAKPTDPSRSPLDEILPDDHTASKVSEQQTILHAPQNPPLVPDNTIPAPEISTSPQPADNDFEMLTQTNPLPNPINLSPEEFKKLENLKALEEEENKKNEQLKALKTTFHELRQNGWDLGEEDDAQLVKPKPAIPQKSLYERIIQVPSLWWEEHITNRSRLEYLARFLGTVRTYTILCAKINNNELDDFIKILNASNAEEGDTWLNESLHQAVLDGKENITRRLIMAASPYKTGLTPKTREAVLKFLTTCADKKRKDFSEDCNEFALDQHGLALAMLEAEKDTPNQPDIATEVVEQCAFDAALALTKCASGGYLPRKQIKE